MEGRPLPSDRIIACSPDSNKERAVLPDTATPQTVRARIQRDPSPDLGLRHPVAYLRQAKCNLRIRLVSLY